jgi:hypothetical protein
MTIHTDKEGWVQDVVKEPSEALIDSAIREVERADIPPLQTRVCKGPYHRNGGKGTPIPVADFGVSLSRYGKLYRTCIRCRKLRNGENPDSAPAITKIDIENGMGSGVHKWRVTIRVETEIVVYGKDFLDAGSEAGEGEIVRIERID